jgi:hypothetical protein
MGNSSAGTCAGAVGGGGSSAATCTGAGGGAARRRGLERARAWVRVVAVTAARPWGLAHAWVVAAMVVVVAARHLRLDHHLGPGGVCRHHHRHPLQVPSSEVPQGARLKMRR